MALVKAVIINRDAMNRAKDFHALSMANMMIPVMFNPPDYNLNRTSRFAELKVPGLPEARLQYVGSATQTLTMKLFFDTTDTQLDVRLRTEPIANLTQPTAEGGAPPRLLLVWGSLIFPCYLTSVQQHYQQFNALGMPLRAELTVEFTGNDALEGIVGQASAYGVAEETYHIIKSGDTLQKLAGDYLRNVSQWKKIARDNDIDDPLNLPVGKRIKIPQETR